MSIPITCQDTGRQCQDILMHLLYSGGSEQLLKGLIAESIANITEQYSAFGRVRDALSLYVLQGQSSLSLLRAVFFVLLNQDSKMRADLCARRFLHSLPLLCPHKACRLYDILKDTVVVEWVKNETIDLLQFEEGLREAYLVS
jgi:hypothetical protein